MSHMTTGRAGSTWIAIAVLTCILLATSTRHALSADESAPDSQSPPNITAVPVKFRDAYETRLKELEEKVLHLSTRLEQLYTLISTLRKNGNTIIAANTTPAAEPPEALPLEPDVVFPVRVAQQQQTEPVEYVVLPARHVNASPRDRSESRALPARKTGAWVIYLASCARQETANRMLLEFRDKGIDAEQVEADVHGKTRYRIRVSGFDNLTAASEHASSIKQQLGLNDAWIMRDW